MLKLLEDLFSCGDAYGPDKERLIKFLYVSGNKEGKTWIERLSGWQRMRRIIMPDWDDSE